MASKVVPVKRSSKDDDSTPPAKRARGRKTLARASQLTLPLDALALVMEFLSPRQLFNLAFTCKTLRGFITTKMVIRSALIHGGHARQTMREIYRLMLAKAMHIPSPLRLLRLANGKRCEFCFQRSVNHVRPCLGVFACWLCTTERGLTKPWKLSWVRYRKKADEYDRILDNPRVAYNSCGDKLFMWASPRRLANRERIGPLATFADVDRMLPYMQKGLTVECYLTNKCHAPAEGAYQEFINTYEETVERAQKVALERAQKKASAKDRAKGNKRAKIEKMIADLTELLEEPYRESAFKKRELNWRNGGSKFPSVEFDIPFIDGLLKSYVVTPSKIRKKILVDIAKTINEKLSLVTKKRLLTLEFLSEDDPFESGLKAHFRSTLTSMKDFLEMKAKPDGWSRSPLSNKFFNLLEKNHLIAALAHLRERDLSCLLSASGSEQERALARTVWFHKLGEEEGKGDEEDEAVLRRAFYAIQDTFQNAQRGLNGYVAWLDQKYPNDSERRSYACRDASEKTCNLLLLINEDYEGLDKSQKDGFERYFWNRFCR